MFVLNGRKGQQKGGTWKQPSRIGKVTQIWIGEGYLLSAGGNPV